MVGVVTDRRTSTLQDDLQEGLLYINKQTQFLFLRMRYKPNDTYHAESWQIVSVSVFPCFTTLHHPGRVETEREDLRTFTFCLAQIHSLYHSHSSVVVHTCFHPKEVNNLKTCNTFVTTPILSTTCFSNDLPRARIPQPAFRQDCIMGGMT